ncbi:glycosyltransferase family 2 protein [Qipengyuania sp.]|uniref:glycosyltransferase family 2 protein n=1 Tax=Qipengyuania sp. TaxID=2004515 RepID=UPI003734F550
MPRIAVIIPAYNAAATIAETLASACGQSMTDIEVVVVDDGSTDETAALVRAAQQGDARIRLIEQANVGVAAARNRAIEASDCAFLAPLDADDLWHRDKLACQLERFAAAPRGTGLVYTWYHPVDAASRIIEPVATPVAEGFVLHRHLVWNFVGNGSAPLIRRKALGDLRYESDLAARGAGGCEDYLLQLQLALNWEFACVPAHLVGYRQGEGRMSGDRLAMLRSHLETYRRMRSQVEGTARQLCDDGWSRTKILEASLRAGRGEAGGAAAAMAGALLNSPVASVHAAIRQARILRKVRTREGPRGTPPAARPSFGAVDPFRPARHWVPAREFARAALLDRDYPR